MKKLSTTIYFYFSTEEMKFANDINIIEVNEKNISNYENVNKNFAEEIINKRFSTGFKLYCVIENEKALSFAWAKRDRKHFFGELNKEIEFDMEVNRIIDCLTLPEARGKGHYSSLLSYISSLNMPTLSLGYTHDSNIPSQKGILKAGFTKRFVITKFLFWYFVKENTGVKFKLN